MAVCIDDITTSVNDAYWVDKNAAQPVLLVDQAADAITEALHRIRSGSVLDDRDLAAAEVALGDLLGGLGQLTELLSTSASADSGTDALKTERFEDQVEDLRATILPPTDSEGPGMGKSESAQDRPA